VEAGETAADRVEAAMAPPEPSDGGSPVGDGGGGGVLAEWVSVGPWRRAAAEAAEAAGAERDAAGESRGRRFARKTSGCRREKDNRENVNQDGWI